MSSAWQAEKEMPRGWKGSVCLLVRGVGSKEVPRNRFKKVFPQVILLQKWPHSPVAPQACSFPDFRYAEPAEGDVHPHPQLRPEPSHAQHADPAHASSGSGVSVREAGAARNPQPVLSPDEDGPRGGEGKAHLGNGMSGRILGTVTTPLQGMACSP